MLTAVLWNNSHHWPFQEDAEAEKVCDLPAVLQLVSARLGGEPTLSGTHPCAQETPLSCRSQKLASVTLALVDLPFSHDDFPTPLRVCLSVSLLLTLCVLI